MSKQSKIRIQVPLLNLLQALNGATIDEAHLGEVSLRIIKNEEIRLFVFLKSKTEHSSVQSYPMEEIEFSLRNP